MRLAALLALPAALLAPALAAEPALGDTRATVEAELGKPSATRTSGDSRISVYSRGTVTYRDERVIALKLISPDELQRRREREKALAEEKRRMAERLEAERVRRLAEANAARDAMLAQPDFPLLSTAGRIERVESLLASHPVAEVAHLLHDLRRTADAEKEARRLAAEADRAKIAQARRIADLSSRLESAEKASSDSAGALADARRRIAQLEGEVATLHTRVVNREELVRTRAVYPGHPPVQSPTKTSLQTSGAAITSGTGVR